MFHFVKDEETGFLITRYAMFNDFTSVLGKLNILPTKCLDENFLIKLFSYRKSHVKFFSYQFFQSSYLVTPKITRKVL
jgi:hypothetical protein